MRQAARAIIVRGDEIIVIHRNKFGKQYYTLPGGGVDAGETPEQALHRELAEELSIAIKEPRLVYLEDGGQMFGTQHHFLCQYIEGEPTLAPDSEEARINKLGQNIYTPMWLKISELPQVEFVSPRLRDRLITDLAQGFSEQTVSF